MYHIAIVEDEREFVEQLKEYLNQYEKEKNLEFKVSVFYDGAQILESYKNEYDLILLDIEMPNVNGMDAALKIREVDEQVEIMFITNMAQYAIQGYSVGALDYVLKPINYYTFAMKMTRVLKRVQKKETKKILLNLPHGIVKLDAKDIYFIEVQNHMLHYHTVEGEYVLRGSLQSAEEMLKEDPFVRCNHWYIVNLRHVKEIRKNIAVVGDSELEISRRNKMAFMKALTEYMGGNA